MSGGFFRKNLIIGSAEILCRLPLIFTLGYLARSVGPEAYGAWALLLVVQTLGASLGSLGLSSSLSRFSPAAQPGTARAQLRLALTTGALAATVLLLAGLLLRLPLGELLGIPRGFHWLLPVSLFLAAGSIADGYLDAYFKAREMLRRQVAFILSRTAAEIVAVVAVFANGVFAEPGEALAAYAAVVLLIKLALYPFLILGRQTKPATPLDSSERGAFLRYGRAMLPSLFVIWLSSQADRVVLGQLVAPEELGRYAFSASLASYLVFLGYAVTPLLLPRASRLFDEGNMSGLGILFARSQTVYLAIIAAALTVIALFSREILLVTAGAQFALVPDLFLVLSVSVCIDQLFGVYQYVFHLVKKPKWIFVVNLVYGLLLALLVSGAVHVGGVAWAPWGVLAAVVSTNVLRYLLARRMVHIPMPPSVVIGLPAALTLTWGLAQLSEVLSIAAKIGVGLTTLAGLTVLLAAWLARQGGMPAWYYARFRRAENGAEGGDLPAD